MYLDNSTASAYVTSTAASPALAAAAATPPPAGKVHRRICGKRMSNLIHDFHSFYVDCRGRECDIDVRCEECVYVTDNVMLVYVKCRLSLQRKSCNKQHTKSTVHNDVPAMDTPVGIDAVAEDPSPDRPPSVVSVQASTSDVLSVSNIQS